MLVDVLNVDVDLAKKLCVGGGGDEGEGGGQAERHNERPICPRGGISLPNNPACGHVVLDIEDLDADNDLNVDEELGHSTCAPPILPVSERQILSQSTIHLLSTLAAACRPVTSGAPSIFTSASEILKTLVYGQPWDAVSPHFQANSLLSIANRCKAAECIVQTSQFILSLNLIQLRTKMES